MMSIQRVGVVGCGLMGSGIAEVCARAGYQVIVREVNQELLQRGLGRIEGSLRRAVELGKLDDGSAQQAREAIRGTLALRDLADSDLVIEAVIEQMPEKQAVLRELDGLCPPHTIFASNTSSLSITVMALVELVRGLVTSEETLQTANVFAQSVGKTVVVTKDYPGFIVNLLLIPFMLDAVRALELGVATKEDIDKAITLGLNHPMGPLTLLDFVGLDTTYYIAEAMYAEFKDARYAAPPLLKKMVLAGHLGRKSGRGFYEYGS